VSLEVSRVDLAEVAGSLPAGADPQTSELLDSLREPIAQLSEPDR
jgi:hypothetical protein